MAGGVGSDRRHDDGNPEPDEHIQPGGRGGYGRHIELHAENPGINHGKREDAEYAAEEGADHGGENAIKEVDAVYMPFADSDGLHDTDLRPLVFHGFGQGNKGNNGGDVVDKLF